MKRIALLGAVTLAASACTDSATAPDGLPATRAAAGLAKAADAEPIAGQYIVVFDDAVNDADGKSKDKVAKLKGKLKHAYSKALKGFAAELSDEAVAALRADPDVAYVEQDQVVNAIATQSNATWGLDRLDQGDLPLSTTYTYNTTGAGVTAYIIDTGILTSHSEFGGRATSGFDAVDGGAADDCNGHGTHVAGTVGGGTYGVAKDVKLVAVRVLNCQGSGTNSGVIAGIDYVTKNHVSPAVANMSLGGGASTALDAAVSASISSGITYGVAAGNGDSRGRPLDACTTSPARTAAAITVGASDKTDREASFSNYGTCVDLLAPGVGITSAWYTGSTATISGTSMATPHVVGVVALYLQNNKTASPATVRDVIVNAATSNTLALNGYAGTPNRLLNTQFIGGGTVAPAPLSASFTKSCTGYSCRFDASGSTGETTYLWSFSNGGTSTAATVSRDYPETRGSYTVSVTVGNGTTTATQTQSVNCNKRGCQ